MPNGSSGDSLIFRRLVDAHADALRRYARRFVRSREAAEDLVQDVFLRLWCVWDRVEVGPNIRAYLYVTTRSRALNHLERERSEERVRRTMFLRGIASDEAALPPEGEVKVEGDEITTAIERVLEMMPPRQREITALRLRDQLTTPEIARRLGISPRTVEVHIARATKLLRERLPSLLARRPAPPRAR